MHSYHMVGCAVRLRSILVDRARRADSNGISYVSMKLQKAVTLSVQSSIFMLKHVKTYVNA